MPTALSLISHRNSRQGFTLIELMVVIVIIGSMMTVGYQLLKTFLTEKMGGGEYSLNGLVKHAREKALSKGQTLTLEFNLEERKISLNVYDPAREGSHESALYSLKGRIERATFEEENDENIEFQPEYLLEPRDFPAEIEKIYSISGLVLEGPSVYVHMYPNGTSDSIFLKLKGMNDKLLYIPPDTSGIRFIDVPESRVFNRTDDITAQ